MYDDPEGCQVYSAGGQYYTLTQWDCSDPFAPKKDYHTVSASAIGSVIRTFPGPIHVLSPEICNFATPYSQYTYDYVNRVVADTAILLAHPFCSSVSEQEAMEYLKTSNLCRTY